MKMKTTKTERVPRLRWLWRAGLLIVTAGAIVLVLARNTPPFPPGMLAVTALLFAVATAIMFFSLDLVLRRRRLTWWQYGIEGALLTLFAFAPTLYNVGLTRFGLPDLNLLIGLPIVLFLDMKLQGE